MIKLLPIFLLLTGCTATGYSVGVDHGFDTSGNNLYNAPHFTRESEKVDIDIQYYRFQNRDDDFINFDWEYKIK